MPTLPKHYSLYNRPKPHTHHVPHTEEKSRTKQEFTRECNINNIISKYHKTGVMDHPNGSGMYEDVSQLPSFQDAMQFTINAQKSFEGLDPNLRKRFANSPHELMEFLRDDNNFDEAVKLKLVPPRKPPPHLKPEDKITQEPE